jgi:hypothetical protein
MRPDYSFKDGIAGQRQHRRGNAASFCGPDHQPGRNAPALERVKRPAHFAYERGKQKIAPQCGAGEKKLRKCW